MCFFVLKLKFTQQKFKWKKFQTESRGELCTISKKKIEFSINLMKNKSIFQCEASKKVSSANYFAYSVDTVFQNVNGKKAFGADKKLISDYRTDTARLRKLFSHFRIDFFLRSDFHFSILINSLIGFTHFLFFWINGRSFYITGV